jgi:GxxExxY protein
MLYSEITKRIIGAAFAVHNELGNGFQEVIYQRALEIEMATNHLHAVREKEFPIFYRGQQIGTRRADFLVEGVILVELKALTELEKAHYTQIRNYLEAYRLHVGLLINFGEPSLKCHRWDNDKLPPPIDHPNDLKSSTTTT